MDEIKILKDVVFVAQKSNDIDMVQKLTNADRCYCSNCNMVTYINYTADSDKLWEVLK